MVLNNNNNNYLPDLVTIISFVLPKNLIQRSLSSKRMDICLCDDWL